MSKVQDYLSDIKHCQNNIKKINEVQDKLKIEIRKKIYDYFDNTGKRGEEKSKKIGEEEKRKQFDLKSEELEKKKINSLITCGNLFLGQSSKPSSAK